MALRLVLLLVVLAAVAAYTMRGDLASQEITVVHHRGRSDFHLGLQPSSLIEPVIKSVSGALPGDIQQSNMLGARLLREHVVKLVDQLEWRASCNAIVISEQRFRPVQTGLLYHDGVELACRGAPQVPNLGNGLLQGSICAASGGLERDRGAYMRCVKRKQDKVRPEIRKSS